MEAILKVKNLKKLYPANKSILGKTKKYVHALDCVNLEIMPGKTFGLLGESGCGKSTLANLILRLDEPTSGYIEYKGNIISKMTYKDLKAEKMQCQIQIVFQNPDEVLSPRKNIEFLIAEPLIVNGMFNSVKEAHDKVLELMSDVDLGERLLNLFPHQLSGGQKQRVCIARALSINPDFIVLDEPTSALDISVQAKILNLLKELQKKKSLTYLLITHDIRVAEYMCDDIAVMYLGEIVEQLKAEEFKNKVRHPYSKLLIESSFSDYIISDKEVAYAGELPSPIDLPHGCRFVNRCPVAINKCREFHPDLITLEDGSSCRCHLLDDN
jgi:oligopeptide/dipeptide ABC transporter ATP-binding protein